MKMKKLENMEDIEEIEEDIEGVLAVNIFFSVLNMTFLYWFRIIYDSTPQWNICR